MKRTNLKSIISAAAALMLCMMLIAGCSRNTASLNNTELASGGVLCLKVNPEIAITYDADGLVTKIDARNDDAKKLIEGYTGFEGKECKTVVTELVNAIGEAGYFVEELEGQRRQITIEIEPGSKLPDRTFLDDVVAEVRNTVNNNQWNSPVDVRGESDYGITDYVDTDYGPNNDGVTDYNNTNYGASNYGNTNYGGNSNYGDSGYRD